MKKILFIEDEPAMQEMLSGFLEDSGFNVVSAYDGLSGLETARREKPDLILLDLILPKKDGFGVLSELKRDEALSSIPVVVLTNLESAEDVDRALESGAAAYLVKTNYLLDEVLEKVKNLLRE
ncbi:MAG: response regulator [Candidatus Sungbacteria bacterium]|nr:response regulator [Candidatus Sungbacteria bacterium]